MTFLENFLHGYESVLHFVATFTVHTLELIGISIIILGAVTSIVKAVSGIKKKSYESSKLMISLGKALALALEFKMGAEIVKTVIVRDLKELAILAIIIALRAVLALLIHWEITSEKKEEHNDIPSEK